ncbi:MAG: hypothetical protein K940chlam8_00606 [Chlamydiae bacterium]|nr:hypothetical protein [Chlamydiota bacterium]
MKKAIFALLTLGTFLNAQASILAYTQNNPKTQGELKRVHNVLFNADILLARIEIPSLFLSGENFGNGVPITYAMQSGQVTGGGAPQVAGYPNILDIWSLKNDHKFGFGAGLGISVSRNVNVSIQYKYLRSGTNDGPYKTTQDAKVAIAIGNADIDQVYFGTAREDSTQKEFDRSIEIKNNFRTRMHILDLVVQATRWMTGRISIQPFAGARYVYEKANSDTNAKDLIALDLSYEANRRYTRSALGVIFGTDIKYMINQYFHFFSSITGQVLGDFSEKIQAHIKSNLSTNAGEEYPGNGTIDYTLYEPTMNVTIRNSWGYKFGFAFENAFKDNWLLSVRIFLDVQENLYKTYGAGFTVGY